MFSFVLGKRICEISLGSIRKLNSFLVSGDFCRLLTTFANSLDSDKAIKNVSTDLDPTGLTLEKCSGNNFWKKLILKKVSRRHEKHENYPACKELMVLNR